jgi:hypothetical protein
MDMISWSDELDDPALRLLPDVSSWRFWIFNATTQRGWSFFKTLRAFALMIFIGPVAKHPA